MAESLSGRGDGAYRNPEETQRIPSSGRSAPMIARMQFIKNRVIAAAADGHNVLQAAIFSET